ncbi:MAG: hypothetical protein HYV26_16255, partial [Candidatus Hydrogenedentes bacterium]|nr:hypothetical protein [Candidatus Hydrogenedentota bacterium]
MTLRLLAVPALALLCCCVIAGCASSGTAAYQEDAARLPRTAPTAQEMETPLSGNGHSALPRREEEAKAAPAQQAKAEPGDAGGPIEESLTIETKRLHGYSFPGMGQETAAPAVAPSAPAPPPALATDTGLETRVAALEAAQQAQAQTASRVLEEQLQAMENRLAELEGRPAQAVETRPEDLEQRFAELGQKLEKLEGRQTALSAGIPEVLNQRMQQMETQLAALENRPAQKVETTPEDVEQRFNEMSAKLAALESAQGGIEDPLRAEIQALENKLAQLENRPPQAVTVSSN